jgi:hypothetical protein
MLLFHALHDTIDLTPAATLGSPGAMRIVVVAALGALGALSLAGTGCDAMNELKGSADVGPSGAAGGDAGVPSAKAAASPRSSRRPAPRIALRRARGSPRR